MPLHVTALIRGEARGLAFNWTEEEVRERVAEPFQRGDPFLVQGQQFDPTRARVTIIESEDSYPVRGEPAMSDWNAVSRNGRDVTDAFLVLVERPSSHAEVTPESTEAIDPRTVMVVYGRDSAITDAIFSLLRALDLKPMEWGQLVAETGEGSPYIGQVLDRAFTIAQAAVVVFTPDDEARLAERLWEDDTPEEEKELKGQPRPNVFFEAGLAFGRFPERSIIVEIGPQRRASDLVGRHAIRLDNSSERRNDLAERLANAGCPVDRSGEGWMSAGDFEPSD